MTIVPIQRDSPAVEATRLSRSFGRFKAVDQVSFVVRRGAISGLIGLNGAGKSTTLRMLTTLLKPTGGTARVMGHDILREPAAARGMLGVVGEDSSKARLDWRLPDFLDYFARLHGIPRKVAAARCAPLVERLIPPEFHRASLDTYSGGMRKKADIIRALLPEPPLLILDEPTKELDIPAKREMWEFLAEAVRGRGLTVLLTSHDALEIETLCGDICVLRQGKVAHQGPASALGTGAALHAALARLLQGEPAHGPGLAPRPSPAEGRP